MLVYISYTLYSDDGVVSPKFHIMERGAAISFVRTLDQRRVCDLKFTVIEDVDDDIWDEPDS
jgi:hypothetical protein